jgi:hypothetical protein
VWPDGKVCPDLSGRSACVCALACSRAQLKAACAIAGATRVVKEWLPCNVQSLVRQLRPRTLCLASIKAILYQALMGFAWLHAHGVVYRVVTLRRLLFDPEKGAIKLSLSEGSARSLKAVDGRSLTKFVESYWSECAPEVPHAVRTRDRRDSCHGCRGCHDVDDVAAHFPLPSPHVSAATPMPRQLMPPACGSRRTCLPHACRSSPPRWAVLVRRRSSCCTRLPARGMARVVR